MSHSYPASELSVEQLVRALAQVLTPDSPLRRKLLDLQSQKIHDVERDLSEVLQEIRGIRNTSIPVNRLPPEILSRVLEYRTRERDLVAATHVCRYWRSTLISAPSLWGRFRCRSNHDLDRTLTSLERSKSTPIDVTINTDLSRDSEVFKYLAPHIARTRSLVMQGSHGIQATSLLFCNPAPSLQRLEIHNWNKDIACLPDNFPGQQAPSLRFVTFSGICPAFQSPFPLPNLVEFNLHLSGGTDLFRIHALFRFLSDSPLLQKIQIRIPDKTVQDIPLDQVISLESLVELEFAYNSGDRVLPHLKLPHLKQLEVCSSLRPGQVQKLVDTLPCDGHALLAGATKMSYYSKGHLIRLKLSGNGIGVSFVAFCAKDDHPSVDWFSDQTCISFGQIEDLKVEIHPTATGFPISAFAFENLSVLRLAPMNVQLIEGCLYLLHPDPVAGVPCRSLREIECTWRGSPEPLLTSLIHLVRERERAGHQLGLIRLSIAEEFDQSLVKELRRHAGEVRVVMT